MKITDVKPFGASITDVDISDPKQTKQLHDLLYNRGFLHFPLGAATPGAPTVHEESSLITLGKIFGTPMLYHEVGRFPTPGYPIERLVTGGDTKIKPDAFIYHVDVGWRPSPIQSGILSCVKKPDVGGSTFFQNAMDMYDRLSDKNKEFLLNNRFYHSMHYSYDICDKDLRKVKDAPNDMEHPHPGIVQHPVSGKPVCFVNRCCTTRVQGLSREESIPILEDIFSEIYSDEGTYEHKWQVGDVVVWDNIGTQHRGANGYEGLRIMLRITMKPHVDILMPFSSEEKAQKAITAQNAPPVQSITA